MTPASIFPAPSLPTGAAIHPGFKARPVLADADRCWRVEAHPSERESALWRLSLTVALDVRHAPPVPVAVETCCGERLGQWSIHVPCPFEPFFLTLSSAQARKVAQSGIRLSLPPELEGLIWFFTDAPEIASARRFLPQLYPEPPGGRAAAFRRTLFSLASLQPFSWLEGCVMDGLKEYGTPQALEALEQHWRYFGAGSPNGLFYCDPRSRPVRNAVYGREGGLPFASLDVLSALRSAPAFAGIWSRFALAFNAAEAAAGDANDYTAEGCYTVAYPSAVAARLTGDPRLAEAALEVLDRRIGSLWHGGALSQGRTRLGRRTFVNWGRGIAWFLLGIIRSVPYLAEHVGVEERLRPVFEEVATWVTRFPLLEEGLWASYADDPGSGAETSGSCGIAAALALGVRQEWLPVEMLSLCRTVRQGALAKVNAEGWLGGVSQINRGGDALQRGGYRIHSAMGMGLLGLLDATLQSMD
ncbi:MAG TPA: glycoside hydrolase family 88 protein [Chthoniobacteraceae bacterium]|nr:glycoside hydrolase family 88 protein [Chthoniobacteraceae bacterium]